MNILGRKAQGEISSVYGKKMKDGANTLGNKLAKVATDKIVNHVVDQSIKHYSPLERR